MAQNRQIKTIHLEWWTVSKEFFFPLNFLEINELNQYFNKTDTSVLKRDLWEITCWERLASPSFRRSKIYERNSRGYCSMLLPNKHLMDTLNQDCGVRESLSNLLVRFTSASNFVFQQQNENSSSSSKIDLSKTR
jgi:hypothetical protein